MTIWINTRTGETKNQYTSPEPASEWKKKVEYSTYKQRDLTDPMDILTNPVNPIAIATGIGIGGMLFNQ